MTEKTEEKKYDRTGISTRYYKLSMDTVFSYMNKYYLADNIQPPRRYPQRWKKDWAESHEPATESQMQVYEIQERLGE